MRLSRHPPTSSGAADNNGNTTAAEPPCELDTGILRPRVRVPDRSVGGNRFGAGCGRVSLFVVPYRYLIARRSRNPTIRPAASVARSRRNRPTTGECPAVR